MTVSELRNLLAHQPGDRRVVVDGYEFGYCDVAGVAELGICLNMYEADYCGPHAALEGVADEAAVRIVRGPHGRDGFYKAKA
jgi:hypothetical protein